MQFSSFEREDEGASNHIFPSGGARGWQEGAEPPPERFEPPLESFETRIEIRKSYVMSALLGAQPPPEYFLGAEHPLEPFSGSATDIPFSERKNRFGG